MFKIDLKVYVKGLDGKEVLMPQDNGKEEKTFLSRILANQLSIASKGIEPLKAYDWAMKLWNKGFIEIDKSDLKKLEQFITESSTLTNLAKGQMLNILSSVSLKEASEKKKNGNND